MSNIYDTANQLEKELREHEAFVNLEKAFNDVQANEEAKELYDRFRKVQMELQQKATMGLEITEEDMAGAQALQAEIEESGHLTELMNNERQLSVLMDDINKIITGAIASIYNK